MEIRELTSFDDHKSVVDLQRAVWGAADIDILSPLSLRASVAAGNLLLGAFDGPKIVGFVYGFLGMLDGQIELHSDMAGLLHDYRDRGLGYRLKLAQRDWALARGIRLVTWTFDPLRSRNAYFNFHKLGAISDSYRVNFYGEDSTSFLHRNSTDRLWISWKIDTARVRDRIAGARPPAIEGQPVVSMGPLSEPLRHTVPADAPRVTIQIPLDPDAVPPDLAARWREVTREAFLEHIAKGYRVIDSNRGLYLLERGDS